MKLLRYLLNTILFVVLWCVMFLPVMKYSIDMGATSIAAIGGIVAIIISYRLVKKINASNLWSNLFNEKKIELNEKKFSEKNENATKEKYLNENQHITNYLKEKTKKTKSSSLEIFFIALIILISLFSIIWALFTFETEIDPVLSEAEKVSSNSSVLDLEGNNIYKNKINDVLKKYYVNDEISEFLNSNCSYKNFLFNDLILNANRTDSNFSYELAYDKKIIYTNAGCKFNVWLGSRDDVYGYYESSQEHLKLINKQLVIDDSKSIPYLVKGIIYTRFNDKYYANNNIRALSAFSKAIEKDSKQPEYYILRSDVYQSLAASSPSKTKRGYYYRLAISDLKTAISLKEKDLFYCFENLAFCYFNLAAENGSSKLKI